MKPSRLNTPGQVYRDFEVRRAVDIPEIQCFLRELVHRPTGAEVMHISCEDTENLFNLSFRTYPSNSNGAAHILEHTVLCGSQKFPIKDPFFSMTRRSLNTFMNALTGSDFTCYPAASQIPKDFYNLLEVYLDAVFHPFLHEMSFLQEGYRLEFNIPTDPTTPLVHKGIVFNEMRGALASGTARLAEAMSKELFPDITYGYNSGGDPQEIPNLSYEELMAFYHTFYHPSRCLFFFYGNIPLENHLDFLIAHTLTNDISPLPPIPSLPRQKRFSSPKRLKLEYPIAPEENPEDKTIIGFGWLTCHILQQEETLALNILEIILMETDASPLKRAFLNSGLCKQASISMDTEISEIPVGLTFRGCDPDAAPALEKVMRETLEKIIHEGISLEDFESAMHQLEVARSEIGAGRGPFGLSLFFRSALLQQHGGRPEDGLMIHSLFEQLRKHYLKDPSYLTDLLAKHFLYNPHFISITMLPNQQLNAQELVKEAEELNKLHQELTPDQIKEILDKTAELEAFQLKQEEESIDVLPKLTLDDVPTTSQEYPLTQRQEGTLKTFHHNCFTNDIIYADLIFPFPKITTEELPLVRLFTTLAPQVGCGQRSFSENLAYLQAHIAGISLSPVLYINVNDPNQFVPSLILRGKALQRKSSKLFSLFKEVSTNLDFTDLVRLKELILKHDTGLQGSLTQNSMKYASCLAAQGLDIPSYLSNHWHGLDYTQMIRHLAQNIDQNIQELSTQLQQIQQRLLNNRHPHLLLACPTATYEELRQHHFYGLTELEPKPFIPWENNFTLPPSDSAAYIVASPVAFTSQVLQTIPYTHPDSPALTIAAGLCENLVLHQAIREQGGAYGGGAGCNPLAGHFGFYAYRDPEISTTLKAFEQAIEEIVKGEFEDSDLEEAKLEVLQTLDGPVAPGSRAELAYSRLQEGKTPETRQAFRVRLLQLTKEDIQQAIKKHILNKKSTTVIFGGKDLIERENSLLVEAGHPPFPLRTI